jgi:ATP-dependent Lhr-like helicase
LVYEFLTSEGAVFFADIQAATALAAAVVESALIELVMAGLVTNDNLETMRQIVWYGSSLAGQPRERKPFSTLEAQLAERRQQTDRPGGLHRPSRAAYQSAKRRVRQRLAFEEHGEGPPHWSGRWTPVHRFGVLGQVAPQPEQATQQARQLLARYGVVTRNSLADEIGAWDWPLIYEQLQQLEMRGDIRRGYFVQGLPGIQFALPEVVERLRQVRGKVAKPEDEEAMVVLNACDPANLYGPAASQPETTPPAAAGPSLTFSRIPSTWVVQQRGLPLLLAEDTGANLTIAPGANEGLIQRALQTLFEHLGSFNRRVTVETWNGEPVLNSPGRLLLEALGFYRDYPGMTWEGES